MKEVVAGKFVVYMSDEEYDKQNMHLIEELSDENLVNNLIKEIKENLKNAPLT